MDKNTTEIVAAIFAAHQCAAKGASSPAEYFAAYDEFLGFAREREKLRVDDTLEGWKKLGE